MVEDRVPDPEQVIDLLAEDRTGEVVPTTGCWKCTRCEWVRPMKAAERFPLCETCNDASWWLWVSHLPDTVDPRGPKGGKG
jgi:hypothetical protein